MKEQIELKHWIYPKSHTIVNGAKNKTSFVQLRDDTFNLKLLQNRVTSDCPSFLNSSIISISRNFLSIFLLSQLSIIRNLYIVFLKNKDNISAIVNLFDNLYFHSISENQFNTPCWIVNIFCSNDSSHSSEKGI